MATAVAVLVSACGGGGSGSDPTPGAAATATTTSPTTSAATSGTTATGTAATESGATGTMTGVVITVSDSEFGPMLFDGRGQAIYLFDEETTAQPACYGDCAAAWPPVLTEGSPQAMGNTRGDLLGTTVRDDGSLQVTYGGHPLYFYADEDPGQVLCHDVEGFGGTWLVVTPEGEAAPA
ncbi:hypothetical protein D0Z06_23140 [Geodermatophilus marinus]|nr:hypothetical protein D0Z06_23140 [Geodermatophilus sp. LHW52908]